MRKETLLSDEWTFWMEGEETTRRNVDLPHDWVIHHSMDHESNDLSQGFITRAGTGCYEKALFIAKKLDHRYFLNFDGVYERSEIYVNGIKRGGHNYGYSPFTVEITDAVVDGRNDIKVIVRHTIFPEDRWYSGAGIYRPVTLIETERTYIKKSDVVIKTELSEGYHSAQIEINVSKKPCRVSGKLSQFSYDEEGNEVIGNKVSDSEISETGEIILRVEEPLLWTAENPNLYYLEITKWDGETKADQVGFKIGLREVKIDPSKGLSVNGKSVKLHGVCLHQDGGAVGIAVRKEIMRQRLRRLKEIGVNAIRPAHHAYASDFLDLCDELGFYVYDECFDKWTGGHCRTFFNEDWQTDLSAMVRRDRNRPSVIIWGVGNEVENQGQNSMLRILEMLVTYLKQMDSTRPVTYAMNPHFKRESYIDVSQVEDIQQFVDESDDTEIFDVNEKIKRIHKIAEKVDILACNYQEQWYEQIHKAVPNKAILGTEVYQYFVGHPQQFKNFTAEIPSFIPEKYPYVIGSMIWVGIDYLGESMGWPMKGYNAGCIRTNLERKPFSYILQSRWTIQPMIHFSVLDYTIDDEGVKDHWDVPPYVDHWDFRKFQFGLIPYMITTNCEDAELWINQQRIYLPKSNDCPNRVITGFLKWEPGIVTVIGKNNGVEVCRYEVKTPGPAVKLNFDLKEVSLPAEKNYQVLLTVRAKDSNNIPCFRESAKTHFRVEGPAKIIAVDSGDCKSLEPYDSDFCHMYRGQATVVIALSGIPGRVKVIADADGLKSAEMIIIAK